MWGLEFTSNGYEIKGATTGSQRIILNFNSTFGGKPRISTASGVTAVLSTTHAATGLHGSVGFDKSGSGNFILQTNSSSATSTLSGEVQVQAGKLVFDSLSTASLSGTNPFPNLTTAIRVGSSAQLQIDRSHALGGTSMIDRRVRLENGGLLLLANARQYLSQLEIVQGGVYSTTRLTSGAGADESDAPALLTPASGLAVTTTASNSIVHEIQTGIEILDGSLSMSVADGAVTTDLFLNGSISSPSGAVHSFTKSGAGTLRATTANTFQGDLVISGGTFVCAAGNAMGAATTSGNGEVIVQNGAAVDLNGAANTVNKNWIIAGSGPGGAGAIVNNNSNLNDNSRINNLTLTANAAIGGNSNFHIGVPVLLSPSPVNGGGHTLTKVGTGEVRLRSASSNIQWKISGGTLSTDVTASLGSAAVELVSGTLRGIGNLAFANDLTISGACTLAAESGTTVFAGDISQAPVDLTLSTPAGATLRMDGDVTGAKGGPGNLIKTGSGGAILNGSFPGTLLQGGTLGGIGTTGSLTVSPGSTLAPGNPHGTLTANGAVSLDGTLSISIQGANSSKFVATGFVSVGPTASLVLNPANNYTQPVYVLMEYGGLGGTFSAPPVAPPGYNLVIGFSGNSVALVSTALSPFEAWAIGRGLTGSDAGPDADPDKDGVKNLLEFLYGTEPNPANPGSNSANAGPVVELLPTNQVTVTYRRAQQALSLNTVLRYGTDPANAGGWQTAVHAQDGIFITPILNGYGPGVDKIVVTFPLPGRPIRFARVETSQP